MPCCVGRCFTAENAETAELETNIGFVFSLGAEVFFFVILFCKDVCADFAILQIGFVFSNSHSVRW